MAATAVATQVTANRTQTIAALNAAINQIRVIDSNESLSLSISNVDGGKTIILSGTSNSGGIVGSIVALSVEQSAMDADPVGAVEAALLPYSASGEAILDKTITPYGYTVYFIRPQFDGTIPSGPAGGDLAGTYPNPTVDGIQGIPVSATLPTTVLDFLHYDGISQWEPAPIGSLPVGSIAGGDLNGFYPNPTVDGIQGYPFQAPPYATPFEWVRWNGASWELAHNGAIQLSISAPATVLNINQAVAVAIPLTVVTMPDPSILSWAIGTPTRITIGETGYYYCTYNLAFTSGGGTKTINSLVFINALTLLLGSVAQGRLDSLGQMSFEACQCTLLFFASAGNFIELYGRRDTNGPTGTANPSTLGSISVWQHKRTA